MKNKKNIDELFYESLKNLEATPSARVWENIQNGLTKQKKERKPIPLWIKYGGIAALIALLIAVGNFVSSPDDAIRNSITQENIIDSTQKTPIQEHNPRTKTHEPPYATVESHTPSNIGGDNNIQTDKTINQSQRANAVGKSSNNAVATQNSANSIPTATQQPHGIFNKGKIQNTGIEQTQEESKNNDRQTAIAGENVNAPNGSKEVKDTALEHNSRSLQKVEHEVAGIEKPEKIEDNPQSIKDTKNKKSILDAIAEKEKEENPSVKNKKQKPELRWAISPNVAPIYYSGLGNGSSIDPGFTNNPQKGDVNMSYGLQVSYALSDRLSIRSGLSNMDLSYSTSDIVIGMGPVSQALGSVDYGTKQIVVTAISKNLLSNGNTTPNNFGEITLKSTGGEAQLIQSINYYEVPLELKYALVNNKLGINLIGGLSTLFLGNNEISVKSDNFSSVLGEANNLSEVSFSTNIGIGLDYKLSKKFVFNIEPMFKYQLNPYTDSAVNFRPYNLGVYSGLSFKF